MSTLNGLEFSRYASFTFCRVEPGRAEKLANAGVVDPVKGGDALFGGERVDTLQLAGGAACGQYGCGSATLRAGQDINMPV